MESRNKIKIENLDLGLLQANFYAWAKWSEEKTDEVLAELKIGLIKLAQRLDLEVVNEKGYLI